MYKKHHLQLGLMVLLCSVVMGMLWIAHQTQQVSLDLIDRINTIPDTSLGSNEVMPSSGDDTLWKRLPAGVNR